ncbi:integrin alpha-PS1 isoform X2 [Rhopalosiphum padi]|uniref:integrin alpha-PS1 isoform X2 n=1 Tax=Rhopalosiphum padi TaxID=40932 RepID=UPI00298E7745|nr:integrin alpha-PS1 isoform X2 [Rhopalosiphum padi]
MTIMSSLPLSLLVLLLCDSAFRAVHCFNLETRLPIVKRSLEVSYFGYSVAGHQSYDELKLQVENSWILVGAPIGKNLQPKTNQSGALYKCPLTSYHDDCIQVVTDGKRTIDSTKLSPPKSDEIKDGQWLGVIVRSQGIGGKVMVCAHRYINRGDEYQWGQGLCYTLTQNLDFVECWEPCKGRETEKGQAQFGYCQAGTSGVLLNDETVVIGSPGSYNWKGNIFMVSVSDDFLHRDKTCYYSPVRDIEVSPVDSHSYLGMSTTADYFFGKPHMVYAAGAPRANGTGQVVLFTKVRPSVNLMDARLVISGEQFASSFGYELATADLNGDKEPDLIVGAPFYFTKETGGAVYIYMNNKDHCLNCKPPIKLVGKSESRFGFAITNLGDLNKDGYDDIAIGAPYEGNGVIYIYQGSDLGIVVEPSQIIKAEDLVVENLKIRTLGYSLSGNGMDLDQNGYPDLISGAYESDMAILIRARPIVDITIEVRPPEKLRNIDPTKTGCSANKTSSVTCFTFETCCTLKSVINDGEWGIQLRYKLEAETFQEGRKFSRVWFGPDHISKSQIIENIVSVDHNKKETCQQHTAYIKENTMDIQSPIAMHISYSLVQNDVPVLRPGDPVPSLADLPVLNQNQAEKTFVATFHKDCGNNDKCESRVHVNAELLLLPRISDYQYELIIGQHTEILLNTSAYNQGESAYESRMFIVHPYSFNYIGTVRLEDTKQVDCNPFNKTLVVCALGNPFKKSAISNIQLRFDPKELNDSENQLEFIVFSNSTSHEVDPQSPLILRANIIKQAELSLKGLARPEQVFYGGQVKDDLSVKYRDEVGSRVLHTYQVFNSGPWKVSNLLVNIDWPYQVASHYTPGKWLLYLDEKPYVEAISGGECFMSQEQVNPLGLAVRPGVQEMPLDSISTENIVLNNYMMSKSTSSIMKNSSSGYYQNRVRREQNNVVSAETSVNDNGKHEEIVKMNCLVGNAKCFKFHCLINNLQKNQEATIFIKARLWNSTLLQLFPKVDSVQIVSRAKIHIPPELLLQQNRSDDECDVETTAKVDLLQQENKPISWWLIILAILVGLLLLILLTLLLWKLGFFKRRRPDPTLSGNIEKHRVDDNYYDY